jgi:hypothetical protein
MTDSPPNEAKRIEHEPASESPEQPRKQQAEQSPVAPNDPNSQGAQDVATQETQKRQDELEERIRRGERWMIYLTGAIAFLALCSVAVGILQWLTMSGQLEEMQSGSRDTKVLAEAAKNQAAAAGKQAMNMEKLATAAAEQAKATQLSADQAKIKERLTLRKQP